MGLSGGLPATQYSFDYRRGVGSNYQKTCQAVEKVAEELFSEIGYCLGVAAGANEVNWESGGYSRNQIKYLTQCDVDCFILNKTVDIDALLAERLSAIGVTFLASDCETVFYENEWVDYISDWTKQPRSEVVEDLIEAGYIDEYDRDWWLAE